MERLLAHLPTAGAKRRPVAMIVWGTLALAACAAMVVALVFSGGPHRADLLERYLASPLNEALALLPPTSLQRDASDIALTTPAGITARTRPDFWWQAEAGTAWRLTLREVGSNETPRVFDRVIPPFRLPDGDSLRAGGVYAASIVSGESALPGAETLFSVAAEATSQALPSAPEDLLHLAQEALRANPARPADALAALFALPAREAQSDQALRLRLWAETALHRSADALRTRASLLKEPAS